VSALSAVSFAAGLRTEPQLREATEGWLEPEAERPEDVPASDWLRFEQEKHSKLLAAVSLTAPSS